MVRVRVGLQIMAISATALLAGCAEGTKHPPTHPVKGSITLDGISLTIARLDPGPVVNVTIIPHTYEKTTLGQYKPGERVNLETDVLAKYVEKLMRWRGSDTLTLERLQELGY